MTFGAGLALSLSRAASSTSRCRAADRATRRRPARSRRLTVPMVWEIVFMLVILKIPIVYLCVVVWWAIKAEPPPPDLAGGAVVADTPPSGRLAAASARRPAVGPSARTPRAWWRLPAPATGAVRGMTTVERRVTIAMRQCDVVAGLLAVASIVLSAIAMGLGLDPGARRAARPGPPSSRSSSRSSRRGSAPATSRSRSRPCCSRWSPGWSA